MNGKRLIASLLLILLISPAAAHSGRTDANGGHWDHSTGEYHYHDGRYAGRSSSSSSSGKKTRSSRKSPKQSEKNDTYSKTEEPEKPVTTRQNKSGSHWIVFFAIIVFGGIITIPVFINIHKNNAYRKRKKYYTDLYGGKSIRELVDIPPEVEIGSDGLPCETSYAGAWGSKYTFYTSKSGQCFHAKYGCCGATVLIHAYHCKQNKVACTRCNPHLPDMTWYEEYLKIQQIMKSYGIAEEKNEK